MWGGAGREESILGHFIPPLLTSVAATRVGEDGPQEDSLVNLVLDTLDDRVTSLQCFVLGGICTVTTPFYSDNILKGSLRMTSFLCITDEEPKLREYHWYSGVPMPVPGEAPAPLGADPRVFPLNQLLPGAGCLGEGLLIPWVSLMSCLHLGNKGNPLGCFWIIYDEDTGFSEFRVGLLRFGFCVFRLFFPKVV